MSFLKIAKLLIEPNTDDIWAGSAIKFTVILDVDTVDTTRLTVQDPSNIEKVDGASMTKEDDRVYSYVWQSHEDNDNEGKYAVIVEAVLGVNTTIKKEYFEIVDPMIDD